ncbi:hypothetical protein FACS189454_08850 [Planctomycetales bacterium]|nr:hypothetical protein FACS189454_08850 [Planctomycetales bacterium]
MKVWTNTLFSALVGGVVGASVVFFTAGNHKSFDNLTVGELTITGQAKLLNKDGKTDDIVFKEGSVLAKNLVVGNKFVGTQYQGKVFVANRMFTTPDDVLGVPMEQWKFFTEIGSSNEMGGEMIVRSATGGAFVNKPNEDGIVLRTGFNQKSSPQIVVVKNTKDRAFVAGVPFGVPQQQQTAPNAAVAGQAGTAAAPISQEARPTPAVASQPEIANPNPMR